MPPAKKNITFSPSRLAGIYSASGFLLSFLLIARLIWLQGMNSGLFDQMAEKNRSLFVVERAPRGQIIDRNNKVLADNQLWYSTSYVDKASGQERERQLGTDEALSLMATSPAQVRRNYVRDYPYGPIFAQLLGYVQLPQHSTDVVSGRAGLERQLNTQLAGKDGFTKFEKNAQGAATRILAQQAAQVGQTLRLNIDAQLSAKAFAALGTQRGAVIITVPQTGAVLTLVSKPSFLPTNDPTPQEEQQWLSGEDKKTTAPSLGAALSFPDNPFLFRPVAAQYPPGSTFKIVTALAGLDLGAINTQTVVHDEGQLKVGDFVYQNWLWRQYGRTEGDIQVVRALARSNDTFFYKVAEWVGPEALANFARLFSFGAPTGIDISGEKSGIIPDPAWKQKYFGEKWFLGDTYHMGIGQGDVLATPLQINTMTSAAVTGGRRCAPRVLADSQPSCQELSIQASSLATVLQGMREVCSAGGTAFTFFKSPYDILCKTGTAEFGAADAQGHRATHAWLTAAVSKEPRPSATDADFTPSLVITVVVESSPEQPFAEGSQEAGIVAKQVVDWWWANQAHQ